MRKTILQEQHTCSVRKTVRKSTKYWGKKDNFENRPSTKGYSPCQGYSLGKMVSLGQKLKIPKTCEKPFHNTSTVVLCKKHLFCAQNSSKKHQILEKKDNLEKRPSTKGYSPCKGYSLCKMVSLGQKLKML